MTNVKPGPAAEATLADIVRALEGVELDGTHSKDYFCRTFDGRDLVVARASQGFAVSYTNPLVATHIKTAGDIEAFKAQLASQQSNKRPPPREREMSRETQPYAPPPELPPDADPRRPADMPQFEDEHELLGRSRPGVQNPAIGIGETDLYPLGRHPSLETGIPPSGGQGGMYPVPFGQSPRYNQRWDPPVPGAPDPRDPTSGVDTAGLFEAPKRPQRGFGQPADQFGQGGFGPGFGGGSGGGFI